MTTAQAGGRSVFLKAFGNQVPIAGYAYGLRHPSLLVRLGWEGSLGSVRQLTDLDRQLVAALPGSLLPASFFPSPLTPALTAPSVTETSKSAALDWLFQWTTRLQRVGGLPVFESGRILNILGQTSGQQLDFWVLVPVYAEAHGAAGHAFSWLLKLLNVFWQEVDVAPVLAELPGLLKLLKSAAPLGSNTPRFLQAAYEMEIPVSVMVNDVFQYGQGARSRWMDSSFSDATPHIGARLARNKTLAKVVLRRAGVPVPAHVVVTDIDGALQAAKELGYPVVVKPSDLDGGVGVAAGLKTPEDVREAFAAAQKHSTNLLVEKHFEGRDYRLTVFQGELIWAIERLPGGVVGDGKSTVGELIAQLNADPVRGVGPHAPLKRLTLDNEAVSLLRELGLDAKSIPSDGQFVRLRRIANVASGGMPVARFDQVHPDNRRLAIRAAQALRLDLAGVDLLVPDIKRSWLETGAAVCEVNGQPSLGQTTAAHLYAPILQKLVQGNGRIPIVVVLGAAPDSMLAREVCSQLAANGVVVGCASRKGVSIGEVHVVGGGMNIYSSSRILLSDTAVDAAVLCINDASILRSGLSFDRFDVLVIAGDHVDGPVSSTGEPLLPPRKVWDDVVNALLPACEGPIYSVAAENFPFPVDRAKVMFSSAPLNAKEAVGAIVAAVLVTDAKHCERSAANTSLMT